MQAVPALSISRIGVIMFQVSLPEKLSPSQRDSGQRKYLLFSLFNAISVACLMENILILYAIRNGLPDPLVATLASFMHLTMPLMILGKFLVARQGLARTWWLCWFLRYVVALLIVAAPLFDAPLGSRHTVWAVLMTGAFGLFSFRSIGMITHTPLMGEVTTERDRGRFISANTLRFHVVFLACTLAIIVILKKWHSLVTHQSIILTGAVVGMAFSFLLLFIPETRTPRDSARAPISSSLRKLWRTERYRRLVLAWGGGLSAVMLVKPFAIITLKNGYGLGDDSALLFSLLGIVGGIAASFIVGLMADHTGPRPLLILSGAGLLIQAVWWALAPAGFTPLHAGPAFLLMGFCRIAIMISIAHYFLSVVGAEDRVGIGIFARIISGLAAGGAASLGGGGLLWVLGQYTDPGLELYRHYFRIITLALIPLFVLMIRLHRLREWPIRDVMGMFFSFRDLRALFAVSRLEHKPEPELDGERVEKLGAIGSTISEDVLLRYLHSARLGIRGKALLALGQIDFGEPAIRSLTDELERGEYTTAWIAAEILGQRGVRDAIPALRKALESGDVFLKGKSMVALVQLGDVPSYPRIIEDFRTSANPRILVQGATALALMGSEKNAETVLKCALHHPEPEPVQHELLHAAARICKVDDIVYRFLNDYHTGREHGVSYAQQVLSELRGGDVLAERLGQSGSDLTDWRAILLDVGSVCRTPLGDAVIDELKSDACPGISLKTACCVAFIVLAGNCPTLGGGGRESASAGSTPTIDRTAL